MKCDEVHKKPDIYHPAFDTSSGICLSQSDPLLFSCAGRRSGLERLCPCREYPRYQIALCKSDVNEQEGPKNDVKLKGRPGSFYKTDLFHKLNNITRNIF